MKPNNLMPKIILMIIIIIYIICQFILFHNESNKTAISFALDSIDYDMPKNIYYDKNNNFNFINAEIKDYNPDSDTFTIYLTEDKEKIYNVSREQIKQHNGEKYIYYPNIINNKVNKLISLYLSVIAYITCMVFILYSIYNENIFFQILNNKENISNLLHKYIHEYAIAFIQIIMLGILICTIFFYKDKINSYNYVDENWKYMNIILILLNLYLLIIYSKVHHHISPHITRLTNAASLINITKFTTIQQSLMIILLLLFTLVIIQNHIFNADLFGYYPFGLSFFILGILIYLGFNSKTITLDNAQIFIIIILTMLNVIYSNSYKYDILFNLLGYNFSPIFTFLLNKKEYNYLHVISIILLVIFILFQHKLYNNLIYYITNG